LTTPIEVGDLFSSLRAHGIERQLQRVVGVGRVSVNPVSGSTTVVYDPGKTGLSAIQEAIEDCAFIVRAKFCPGMFAMTTLCRAGPPGGPISQNRSRAFNVLLDDKA
jgi:copper chaperone CopZ